MTLRARQNPQNRYHPKLGAMVTLNRFSESSSARIAAKAMTSAAQLALGRPFSPASRKREGSMPVMSPMNRQTDGSG